VDTTGGDAVTAEAFRVLVTGSREWDDAQELRLALIHATAARLDSAVRSDPSPAQSASHTTTLERITCSVA